jgi:hypothetical protein
MPELEKIYNDAMVEGAIEETERMLSAGELKVEDPQMWIAQVKDAISMDEVWTVIQGAAAEHKANGGGVIQ